MCLSHDDRMDRIRDNEVHVCDLCDLQPGAQYRTPEGDTMLVTECLFDGPTDSVQVVNIRTGRIALVAGRTKLGRDRAGRLYASRYLNPPVEADEEDKTPTLVDEEVDLGAPVQAPPDVTAQDKDEPNTTTMGDI
jgi:hypothetical protein